MLRVLCFVVGMGWVNAAVAQQSELTINQSRKSPRDSIHDRYIKSYPDKFFLWPVIKQRQLAFELQNPKQVGNTLQFKPNNAVGLGVGMYVFDLGLELVFSVPVADEKEITYGKTNALDLQLNILSKKFGADIYYQRYEGFYLSNPDPPIPPGGVYPHRADATTENFGLAGIYVFNHNKFSLRSAFTFADRQLKSRGSFTLGGTYNTFRLSADSAILNSQYATRIGLTTPISGLRFQTLGIAPGYAHNFVIKKFFFSLSIAIGPAVQFLEYKDVNGNQFNQTTVNSIAEGRLAFGYSTDRFFTGLTYVSQSRNVRFENIQFGSTSSTFRLLFGWRFQEFGILKKSVWSLLPKGS